VKIASTPAVGVVSAAERPQALRELTTKTDRIKPKGPIPLFVVGIV
jgi:hypothetical protein